MRPPATIQIENPPARVSLIGLPGSGKTTVGRHLARRLRCGFVDADAAIVRRSGCSIADLFEREGEAAFRDLEEQVIAGLMHSFSGVIATGGGAVLREANRLALRGGSVVVYLRSSPETILGHLRVTKERPLLSGEDPLVRLRELQATREAYYRETAHISVEAGRIPMTALVSSVAARLAEAGFPGAG